MTKPDGAVLVAGSANVDFVVRAAHIPAPGETVLGGDLTIVPGGKGANQAVACARAGGVDTRMLAALGDDPFAPILEASLRGAGVSLHVVRSDRPTGAALITVSDEAENAITVAPGANGVLAAADLPALAGTSWLLLQLETPLPTVVAFAQTARTAGVGVILNAAPAQALPGELIAATDLLVVNEEELRAIAGADGSIAEQLARAGADRTVVTLGGRGCVAYAEGRYLLQEAFAVTPVDTTAAGDTFCGTLAAALALGEDLRAAMRTAAAAAALSTTRHGAQTSVPTHAEVAAMLATMGDAGEREALAAYCGVTADNK